MSQRLIFRLVVAALVVSFVVASLFIRRAPVPSGLVLAFVSSVFVLRAYLQRRREAVVAAADRGDVEVLTRLAAKSLHARYEALVALAVFESADAVLARPHRACLCGEDCGHVLNDDVEAVLRAVSSMQAGNPARAITQLKARVTATGASETYALQAKSIVRDMLICCVMVETDRLSDRAEVDGLLEAAPIGARFLRGPLHLATAGWRIRHGDAAGARSLLGALPRWKAGSRLATKRDELTRESASVARDAEKKG